MKRWLSFLILAATLLGGCTSRDDGESDRFFPVPNKAACTSNTAHSLTLPAYPNSARSETIPYIYQFINDAGPQAATIVFLPGGPGQDSIGFKRNLFAKNANIVLIDSRGIGCNDPGNGNALLDELYQTEYLAADVLAVIRDLGLRNYYIHGVSYGTVLGTVVASLAEKEGMAPKGLILEGVVGRAYQKSDPDPFLLEWSRIKGELLPPVLEQLRNNEQPLGIPHTQWDKFIRRHAAIGEIPDGGNFIVSKLNTVFSAATPESEKEKILSGIRRNQESLRWSTSVEKLYKNIACHELWEDARPRRLVKDEYSRDSVTENPCKDRVLDRPFDSKKYPLTTPIYYFQGGRDHVVPFVQAQYHFDNQIRAPRKFIEVPTAGHNPLSTNFDAFGDKKNCKEIIWDEILKGGSDLQLGLKHCPLKSKFLSAPASAH